MVDTKKYHLPPTALVPNSPKPVLHYKSFFSHLECTASNVCDVLYSNGWRPTWLNRYGPTQASHYHSSVHECMVVLSGRAKILWGVSEVGSDGSLDKQEEGGVLVEANVGDVFVIPSGVAHKSHDPEPVAEAERLSPGDGHSINDEEMRAAMAVVQLSGFTMLGAYPIEGNDWDFALGGASQGRYEEVWAVPMPKYDPVLGESDAGICGQWT